MAESLQTYAVEAERNLEALATGLAKAGVDDSTVQGISRMADVVRKVVLALGKGQERTADDEAPEREPAEEPAPETVAQQPQERRPTMDSATADLYRDAQAKAAQRRSRDPQ